MITKDQFIDLILKIFDDLDQAIEELEDADSTARTGTGTVIDDGTENSNEKTQCDESAELLGLPDPRQRQ